MGTSTGGGGPSYMYHQDSLISHRGGNYIDPLNWWYRIQLDITFTDDMIIWLKENCNGRWFLRGWSISRISVLRFCRPADAMAFKLRWL